MVRIYNSHWCEPAFKEGLALLAQSFAQSNVVYQQPPYNYQWNNTPYFTSPPQTPISMQSPPATTSQDFNN